MQKWDEEGAIKHKKYNEPDFSQEHSSPEEAGFHYSRKNRLKLKEEQGSVREPRKNRGNLILLVDIAIILLFVVVYNFFLKPDLSVQEFGGYRFELRALAFDGETLASLKITALNDLPTGSPGLLRLEFSPNEDFSEAESILEAIPNQKSNSITTRLRLPLAVGMYARGDILPENEAGEWDFELMAGVEPE